MCERRIQSTWIHFLPSPVQSISVRDAMNNNYYVKSYATNVAKLEYGEEILIIEYPYSLISLLTNLPTH